tara:strand:- start:19401 stop:19640 length:240 start_codon:yes stop_codon:yes gene_type:complete
MFDNLETLLLSEECNFSKLYEYCKEMRRLKIPSTVISKFIYNVYLENESFFEEDEVREDCIRDISDILDGYCSQKISLR